MEVLFVCGIFRDHGRRAGPNVPENRPNLGNAESHESEKPTVEVSRGFRRYNVTGFKRPPEP